MVVTERNNEKTDKKPVVTQVLTTKDSEGQWSPLTFELLSDAFALAKRLQGSCGAWVLSPDASTPSKTGELAQYGCTSIDRLVHSNFANWASETIAFALARHTLPSCRVIFLPSTSRGEEIAALLCEALQAVWIPDTLRISTTRTGSIEITAIEPGGKLSHNVRLKEDQLAIITMREGVAEMCKVDNVITPDIREVQVDLSKAPHLTHVEKFLPADPKTVDITFANKIVAAGRGTAGPKGMELVAQLADDLEAATAASRMAVDLGWASQKRQVGQTGRTVRPKLYVACGISGASHHIAGMRNSQNIIALNSDESAPIHEISHLSLYGDLHKIIPEIRATLKRRKQKTPQTDP